MVKLSFVEPVWDPDAKRMEYRLLADVVIDADARSIQIVGDASVFSTDIPVVEPDTGERLTFAEHGERWARALPTAYRAGDLLVRVVGVESRAPATSAYA